MYLFKTTNWWETIQWDNHVLWSIAVIASVFLLIIVLLDVFGMEVEEEAQKKKVLVGTRSILFFLAVFSWLSILINRLSDQLVLSVLIGFVISGVCTLLVGLIYPNLKQTARQSSTDVTANLAETGQVSQSVPPHRNGFGKVQLITGAGRKELDAITAGQALPTGAPVRVVDVIDDRVILVEPIVQKDYPHE
ncbi:MAG: hypothetical protein AAF798_02665 [Bacteroidota bacterium]